jgi:hypothetical protein
MISADDFLGAARRQEDEKDGSQFEMSQRSRRPPWVSCTVQAAPCSWIAADILRNSGTTASVEASTWP